MLHNKDEVLLTPFFFSSDHDDDFNSAGKEFNICIVVSIRALTGHFLILS